MITYRFPESLRQQIAEGFGEIEHIFFRYFSYVSGMRGTNIIKIYNVPSRCFTLI